MRPRHGLIQRKATDSDGKMIGSGRAGPVNFRWKWREPLASTLVQRQRGRAARGTQRNAPQKRWMRRQASSRSLIAVA
jgi:hypothetical protein